MECERNCHEERKPSWYVRSEYLEKVDYSRLENRRNLQPRHWTTGEKIRCKGFEAPTQVTGNK